MDLSIKAKSELRDTLVSEIGLEAVSQLSEDDINHLGVFLLTTFSESLKLRCSIK